MTPDELRRLVDRFDPPMTCEGQLIFDGRRELAIGVMSRIGTSPGRAVHDAQALCDLINACHDIATRLEKAEQAK